MQLQDLSKSICKNTVFKYLLNKYDGDANDHGIPNRNINFNFNVNNNNNLNIYANNRNNRNNANFHQGIYQGWRTGRIGNASRWNT